MYSLTSIAVSIAHFHPPAMTMIQALIFEMAYYSDTLTEIILYSPWDVTRWNKYRSPTPGDADEWIVGPSEPHY